MCVLIVVVSRLSMWRIRIMDNVQQHTTHMAFSKMRYFLGLTCCRTFPYSLLRLMLKFEKKSKLCALHRFGRFKTANERKRRKKRSVARATKKPLTVSATHATSPNLKIAIIYISLVNGSEIYIQKTIHLIMGLTFDTYTNDEWWGRWKSFYVKSYNKPCTKKSVEALELAAREERERSNKKKLLRLSQSFIA